MTGLTLDRVTILRQGDVLLELLCSERAAELLDHADPIARDRGRLVLAYGELTGHVHAIAERGAALYDVGLGAERALVVTAPALLRHEEHRSIELAPGTYLVRRQREYEGLGTERIVAD